LHSLAGVVGTPTDIRIVLELRRVSEERMI
jgi:hypothetical protein